MANAHSTLKIAGHPLHPMLVPIPIACYVGTLLSDLTYWKTANMQWANFSAWMLAVGVVVTVLAALAGIVDFLGSRGIRALRPAWIHAVGNLLVLGLAVVNLMVHSRDAYTSVVPLGVTLSVLVVLILMVTGWNGWSLVYRHGVATRPEDRA